MRNPSVVRRIATCVAILAAFVLGEAGASEKRQPVVIVEMVDYPRLSRAEVSAVQSLASSIYSDAGVRLLWSKTGHPQLPDDTPWRVRVVLLTDRMANRMIAAQQIGEDVLGFAVSPARIIYVFCHRITMAADRRGLVTTTLLSRVIAHELGDILLSSRRGHSPAGIMRPTLAVRSERLEVFSEDERARIRALAADTQLRMGSVAARWRRTPSARWSATIRMSPSRMHIRSSRTARTLRMPHKRRSSRHGFAETTCANRGRLAAGFVRSSARSAAVSCVRRAS